jgi:hypothetical protein
MNKAFTPELTRTINQQAHILAAQSFAPIRNKLNEKAKALLREGVPLAETLRLIQALQTEGLEP